MPDIFIWYSDDFTIPNSKLDLSELAIELRNALSPILCTYLPNFSGKNIDHDYRIRNVEAVGDILDERNLEDGTRLEHIAIEYQATLSNAWLMNLGAIHQDSMFAIANVLLEWGLIKVSDLGNTDSRIRFYVHPRLTVGGFSCSWEFDWSEILGK